MGLRWPKGAVCSMGPRVREKHQQRRDPWYTTTSASALLCPLRQRARFLRLKPWSAKLMH